MTASLVGFDAWAALAGDSPTSRTEWAALVAAWSEPHRRYHDLAHLAAVLGVVGSLADAAGDPDAVRLAAWYHDAVYDPRRDDNERVSADRARAGLRGLVADERIAEVERLVLLTAGHEAARDDPNGAVLCDADLAVLAGPPESYATYASAVRAEYAHLSDAAFTAGRIAVLERLLALPALYRLPVVAADWEPRARANLSAELALLRRRAGAAGPAADPPSAAGPAAPGS
ncbi:metal-dependent phosphohydrolase [Geodermatophilus sp. YIM 151500]|uniref:HD domain-containing protein n=1 Tax=Geodermatophilus sp. YIM 151500 TaxID=2984531 RepID=UPI0021E3EA9F|nr:metal-dependent phosphohydrolase [Geodermatophilus sp. YIM 151500]MCV2489666.1 metal-dependent phosphohydrolase [Geodermatophilus sp. YIM 151500]